VSQDPVVTLRDDPGQTGPVEEVLQGGVANAGRVTRDGDHVLRPSNANSLSIHRFLSALRSTGFDGASAPVGIEPDGRERLVFIEGEVALPPYPRWAQSDDALRSIVVLLKAFHRASTSVTPDEWTWSSEMADVAGGPIICHNDICLENVVFRDDVAVGLIDFDFAAPGRPVYDVAQFARMCVPVDDDEDAERFGWEPSDTPARLRLVADCYGLHRAERHEVVEILAHSMAHGGDFVRRRVEAGDANFTAMWKELGGMERYDRRRRWWEAHRPHFADAME